MLKFLTRNPDIRPNPDHLATLFSSEEKVILNKINDQIIINKTNGQINFRTLTAWIGPSRAGKKRYLELFSCFNYIYI